ncbi:MAG: hypothetical protein ACRDDZ_11095 [Marinifilaceae bacterium]
MATINEIKNRAAVIKNETIPGANTANRIGGLLEDMALEIEKKKNADGGKVLSDNNYTTLEKNKVENLPENVGSELTKKADLDENGKIPLSQIPTNYLSVYGVKRRIDMDATRWEPYNESLLKIDPVWNSRYLAVVNDDMTDNYILDPQNAGRRLDGGPVSLDGTDGQVMIVIPGGFYYFDGIHDHEEYKLFSTSYFEIGGMAATFVDDDILSAPSLSTIQRSTGKLASVFNRSLDYRGGTNVATLDEDSDASLLGRCAGNLTRVSAQNAAYLRGAGWQIEDYEMYRIIRNMVIVHNCCSDWWADPVRDGGVYRGGSGSNWSNLKTYEWIAFFNGIYANPNYMLEGVLQHGIQDGFITKTWRDGIRGRVDKIVSGAIYCNEVFQYRDASFWIGKTIQNDTTMDTALITGKDSNHQLSLSADIFTTIGHRWRILGFDISFSYLSCGGWDDLSGTMWQWIAGINIEHRDDQNRFAYILKGDADTGSDGYSKTYQLPSREGYVKEMHGMMPASVGSGTGKRYACYFYAPAFPAVGEPAKWTAFLVGGSAHSGRSCAPWYVNSYYGARSTDSSFGARLSGRRPQTRRR